ncbi:MAG: GNAT family N-acetyltransferase [Pseudomonadota bacterium]
MIVRAATPPDAVAMADLLNRIIHIGGTTAHEVSFTPAQIDAHYISGQHLVCCHLALLDHVVLGFQSLERHADLPADWADIGTFVDPDQQRLGIGGALFAATAAAARAAGIAVINATIRADNWPGLGYYARRGFVDHTMDPDYALRDGRVVGRISKRFDLG